MNLELKIKLMRPATRLASGMFALTSLVFTLLNIGCLAPKTIVGKWRQEKSGERVEYFKDGTFIANPADGSNRQISGKYTVIDEHRLKIELGGTLALAGPFVSTYTLSGDTLSMSAPDGSTGTYQRVE